MNCPLCGGPFAKIDCLESRAYSDRIRRRRTCRTCNGKFSTVEMFVELKTGKQGCYEVINVNELAQVIFAAEKLNTKLSMVLDDLKQKTIGKLGELIDKEEAPD